MSNGTSSWLERLILAMAPQWGLRRAQARLAARHLSRHYDAAASSRRTEKWPRRATDANAAILGSMVALRNLARDVVRNNGWASRAIEILANNTVGWGIEAKATGVGNEDEARQVWSTWSNTTSCDYDGMLTFTGLQRLVMETVAESGEALVLRESARSSDGLPVPIRLRVLEPDYIDHNRHGVFDGRDVAYGIELDQGRRVAYWLYEEHPGASFSAGSMRSRFRSRRVPASDVIHCFRVRRPGQMRGVSWLAAALVKLNDLEDLADARLMQARIQACFAAFVTDMSGQHTALGEEDASAPMPLEDLEPGQINYLDPGQNVEFARPPNPADMGGFSRDYLRQIAAAFGVSYESLTGDYSQVTFSSARMGRIEAWKNVHNARWNMLIPQFCDRAWKWVMEMAAGIYGWPAVPRATWSPPPMEMLEPEKEGLALTRLVRGGIMSLPQVLRERGEDFEEHLQEIARANQRLDELGIWVDSDPRRVSAAGLTQQRGGDGGGDESP